jgi:hypothetical protein
MYIIHIYVCSYTIFILARITHVNAYIAFYIFTELVIILVTIFCQYIIYYLNIITTLIAVRG